MCLVADDFVQRMMDDPELQKHNLLPPGAPGSLAREAAVIFKLASHLKPGVRCGLFVHLVMTAYLRATRY